MTIKNLTQAMPIVATALGRRFGVQVIVGGRDACTDGQHIWLPDLPPESELRPVAWGLLAHEASHVRHTDMTVFQREASASPLRQHLLNVLEDVRIERAIRRDYPGTQTTLEHVIDWMLATGQLQTPTTDAHPAQCLTGYLLLALRWRVLGQQALAESARQAEQVLRQTFPATLVYRLMGLMSQAAGLESTTEAALLAARIEALLEDEATAAEASPPSTPGMSSDDTNGADGDADSASAAETSTAPGTETGDGGESSTTVSDPTPSQDATEAEAEAEAETPPKVDGRPSQKDAADGPGPDAMDQAEGDDTAGGAGGETPSGTAAERLRQTLAATADALEGDLFERVRRQLGQADTESAGVVRLPAAEDAELDPVGAILLLGRVRSTSRVLIARLQGLVQASRLEHPCAVEHGRQLMTRRLYRVALGETRLFARHREQPAPNTAVHLLVDLSGSMGSQVSANRYAYQIALEASLALALALEAIPGVSVAVTAFPGDDGTDETVTRLVQHGQRVARRAGAFERHPRGGTPLAQALWYAAADLLLRPEPRRLVLTLTDGDPNDRALALSILEQCEQAGIEAVGIGIQYDVSTLFRHSQVIESIADLKTRLFRLTERLLA